MIASGFSWFHLIPGVEDGSLLPFAQLDGHSYGYVFVSAWVVCFAVIAFAFVGGRAVKAAAAGQGVERYYAQETLGARTAAEILVGGIMGFMSDVLDKKSVATFLPLVGGLFTYILFSNLMALLPGFQPPTDNINTNVAMALVVFVAYWGVGLTKDPKGFVAHLMGPVLLLSPLIFAIEMVSLLLVRPASLAVRLTGNIFGDHAVFNIMSGLVPILVPVIFLGLATLVSLIQAYVFSLLTTIYISQSLPHGDHDDHAHH